MHRRARGFGVVGGDRSDDRIMVLDGFERQVGGVEMLLHAPPQLGALVPQAGDDELERAVAGRLGDPQMKLAVDRLRAAQNPRCWPPSSRTLSRNASMSDCLLLTAASAAISPSTSLRASSSSNGPGPCIGARRLARRGRRGDENAGADAHLDQAADLQRDDRFAHRRAADAERCGELALRRQPRARRETRRWRSAARSARRSVGTDAAARRPAKAKLHSSGHNRAEANLLVRSRWRPAESGAGLPCDPTRAPHAPCEPNGLSTSSATCPPVTRSTSIIVRGYTVVKWSNHQTTQQSPSPDENHRLPRHRLLPRAATSSR